MPTTLWMFAKGSNVTKYQMLLNQNGAIPKFIEDGKFGKNAYNAVKIPSDDWGCCSRPVPKDNHLTSKIII